MNVPVQNGQLPSGFCFTSFQDLLNQFTNLQFVSLSTSGTGYIAASTPPADHTVAWLQLDSSGRPVRRYFFAQGAWLSPHPLFSGFMFPWAFALPEATNANLGFPSFDGGDANPISAISGPMWQLAKATLDGSGTTGILGAQVPLGVGTLPSGTTVAVTNTGGEEKHTLAPLEQGNISFQGTFDVEAAGADHNVFDTLAINGVAINFSSQGPKGVSLNNNALPHNVLNPYYGVYWFQRTNRQFYVVNA